MMRLHQQNFGIFTFHLLTLHPLWHDRGKRCSHFYWYFLLPFLARTSNQEEKKPQKLHVVEAKLTVLSKIWKWGTFLSRYIVLYILFHTLNSQPPSYSLWLEFFSVCFVPFSEWIPLKEASNSFSTLSFGTRSRRFPQPTRRQKKSLHQFLSKCFGGRVRSTCALIVIGCLTRNRRRVWSSLSRTRLFLQGRRSDISTLEENTGKKGLISRSINNNSDMEAK